MESKSEWFESWFDTEWYHILYQNRDHQEAEEFIEELITFLSLDKRAKLLDAACGAGRHSLQLHKLGYSVHGFDLSEQSIAKAKMHETSGLSFEVADLRKFSVNSSFNAIFSFFTSFGYFDSKEENIKVLRNFRNALQSDGFLLIDFMNSEVAIKNLVNQEVKVLDGITFDISRQIENGMIIKKIEFTINQLAYSFNERVSAFTLSDFEQMLTAAGFKIDTTFGDYKLGAFSSEKSPRLIILARPN